MLYGFRQAIAKSNTANEQEIGRGLGWRMCRGGEGGKCGSGSAEGNEIKDDKKCKEGVKRFPRSCPSVRRTIYVFFYMQYLGLHCPASDRHLSSTYSSSLCQHESSRRELAVQFGLPDGGVLVSMYASRVRGLLLPQRSICTFFSHFPVLSHWSHGCRRLAFAKGLAIATSKPVWANIVPNHEH